VEKESSVAGAPAAAATGSGGSSGTVVASRSAVTPGTSPAPVEEFTIPDYQRGGCVAYAGRAYSMCVDLVAHGFLDVMKH
jgi:hypothetical protein